MVIKKIVACLSLLMSMSLWGMQQLSFNDLCMTSKTKQHEATTNGMNIQEHVRNFSKKNTTLSVGATGYYVFDCSTSHDLQKDIQTIPALMKFDYFVDYPVLADIFNTIDEIACKPYALIKQRKLGDVSYGFKKYIAPHMHKQSRIVYIHFLSIMRDYQISGLGKQIMLDLLKHLLQSYPDAIVCWTAHAYNQNPQKNTMTNTDLENFYKQWGCNVVQDGSGFCYIDISKVDLGLFKPKSKL